MKREMLGLSSCLILLAIFSLHAGGVPALRIMPLGDSITYGAGSEQGGGYRTPLYSLLQGAGYNVDLIGTATDNPGPLPDRDHEGHSGWKISSQFSGRDDGIYEHIIEWFSILDDPHLILLHIGTNDTGCNDFEHAIDRWDSLIERIAACHPDTAIIATTLLERGGDKNQKIKSYFNPFVETRVRRHQEAGRNVHFLDMNSFVPLSDMPDKLHPNDVGYAKMAEAWFTAITNLVKSPESVPDNSPALLKHRFDSGGEESVTLTFNLRIDPESATNSAHYSVPGGEIDRVTCSADLREVTLFFRQPLPYGQNFTLSLSEIRNEARTTRIKPVEIPLSVPLRQGARYYVPEFRDYRLVYSIDIPASGVSFLGNVPYDVDNSLSTLPFNRVAYYLELKKPGEQLQYIWVSFDAIIRDPAKIGIPTLNTGVQEQSMIENLKVWSNVPGTPDGERARGNIEFFANCYTEARTKNLEGASDTEFDFDDTIRFRSRGKRCYYGSMQIHDTDARKTLLAYNRWTYSDGHDIGIGNNPVGASDWTFMKNSPSYEVRRLQVYVRPDPDAERACLFPVSASLSASLKQIRVTFSKPVSEDLSNARFELDRGGVLESAERDKDDPYSILLDYRNLPDSDTAAGSPSAAEWMLSLSGVRDATPCGLEIIPGATIRVAKGNEALPSAITSQVSPELTEGYELLYELDIPIVGTWIGNPGIYRRSPKEYPFDFDRVAYFIKLTPLEGEAQYLWVSFDSFTGDYRRIGIPFSAGEGVQRTVSHMDVDSNAPTIVTGRDMEGGNVEFWPYNFNPKNEKGIPGASDARYDFGDRLDNNGGYGCFQIHNYKNGQTLFAINHWGGNGNYLDVGIGNNPADEPDWTFSESAERYAKRELYILVRPSSETFWPVPEEISNRIPDAGDYTLLCDLDIPTRLGFSENPDREAAAYKVDHRRDLSKRFDRVAYYLELVSGDLVTTQYIWTAFDTYTPDPACLSIPTLEDPSFQQRIFNLDVISNVEGIYQGRNIQTGNIEITPNNYESKNSLWVPGASGSNYDYGDSFSYQGRYGCFQVHNYGEGQVLFAINNLNDLKSDIDIGIGNAPGANSDWTFSKTGGMYSRRRLVIMVKDTLDREARFSFEICHCTLSRDLSTLCLSLDKPLPHRGGNLSQITIDNGAVEIASARRSSVDDRDILLFLADPLEPGSDHTLCVSTSAGDVTTSFRALSCVLPPFMNVENIPEIGDYQLVNMVEIGTEASYSQEGPDYRVDESRFRSTGPFDRIAYCLEVERNDGVSQWVWVSMDAFTSDLAKIGVPCVRHNIFFQQYVDNLQIFAGSNGAQLPVHTGSFPRGNIEFWPGNYKKENQKSIPGAGNVYDFGDSTDETSVVRGHGSMQVHNYLERETVFAVNSFGHSGGWDRLRVPSIGIGNCPEPEKGLDWTMALNSGDYRVRNLYVWVRPSGPEREYPGDSPVFISQPGRRATLTNRPVTLKAYAQGAVRYQWRRNGKPIPWAESAWLEVVSAKPSFDWYDVIAYGADGSWTFSESASVQISTDATLLMIR